MPLAEKLSEFFSQFGPVAESLIMKDAVSQRPRGFGFITFETEEGKNEALKNRFYIMGEKKVRRLLDRPICHPGKNSHC